MNLTDFNKYARLPIVNSCVSYYPPSRQPVLFYGWYIVAVGFLSQMVLAFHLSSTLSVFLKPLTEELCVSRGLFSLMRSGELIIAATIAPFVGSLVCQKAGAGDCHCQPGSGFLQSPYTTPRSDAVGLVRVAPNLARFWCCVIGFGGGTGDSFPSEHKSAYLG
jgi:hypothetical protein